LLVFVRSDMEQAKVKTRLDLDPAPTTVRVDPNQIRAALLNLLRNAREAMPEGGHIVMRIRSLSGQVFIEVKDSGLGISRDIQDRLYEPFFSTKAQGTGLGLSMVKQIVDGHDGSIEVESQNPTGTTFRLIFDSAPPSGGTT
jgi:two-component system NtrC family sensor kinase